MGGAPQARGAGAERALPRGAEAEPPLVAAGGAPVQDPRQGCIASVNPVWVCSFGFGCPGCRAPLRSPALLTAVQPSPLSPTFVPCPPGVPWVTARLWYMARPASCQLSEATRADAVSHW